MNFNTNPKIIWDFIKKITNKNSNPINYLSQRSTNKKHIANLIAQNFAQVSSTKEITQINQNQRKEQNKIHF